MLAPLASETDLDARGITLPSSMDADTILDAASATVREAAGCPISETTSTVTLIADDLCELRLPAGPVTAVASVTVASVPLTGWTKLGDTILMPYNWTQTLPVEVVVVYTHGLPVVPSDIVDLVCSMVAIAFSEVGGYAIAGALKSVRLGDYQVAYNRTGDDSASPLGLPDSVRQQLRARFGNSIAAVRTGRA